MYINSFFERIGHDGKDVSEKPERKIKDGKYAWKHIGEEDCTGIPSTFPAHFRSWICHSCSYQVEQPLIITDYR